MKNREAFAGITLVALAAIVFVGLGVLAHQKDTYNSAVNMGIDGGCAYYDSRSGDLVWKTKED
mgnify:CR=1 FL=1|tara:strand:+ start:992 stop:1180 length:189 start_codon:yes stop_codon:yes gene_type:complete